MKNQNNLISINKSKAKKIIKILKNTFKNAKCDFKYQNPFQLLVAIILSQQTKDENVIKILPSLFEKFKNIRDFAKAKNKDLETIIKSIGLYKTKANNIILSAKQILTKYNGKIPKTLDKLTKLPGVGRKTANVFLGNFYKIPKIAVDTHVKRISFRIGFTIHKDPFKIEQDLMKIFDKKDWIILTHLFIRLGRTICVKKPKCDICPIKTYCNKNLN